MQSQKPQIARNHFKTNETATSTEPQMQSQKPQIARNRFKTNETATSTEPQMQSQDIKLHEVIQNK